MASALLPHTSPGWLPTTTAATPQRQPQALSCSGSMAVSPHHSSCQHQWLRNRVHPKCRSRPFRTAGTRQTLRLQRSATLPTTQLVAADVSLDSVPSAPAQPSEAAQPAMFDVLNWYQQWYPVAVVDNLDPKRPHTVDLLGMSLVLWQDKGGTWRCMEDRCPHRLAPLSEGRLEDGKLACAYHGWEFDGEGKCTRIPQIVDPKALATACASPRSCVKAFPVKVVHGLLMVFTDSSPQGWLEAAACEPAAVPELLDPAHEYKMRSKNWFVRDLPIRFDTLMENVMDPSHVPFSHHGVQGDRKKAVGAETTWDGETDCQGGVQCGHVLKHQESEPSAGKQSEAASSPRPNPGPASLKFQPPCHVRYELSSMNMVFAVYAVPTKPGWSRLIAVPLTKNLDWVPWYARALVELVESLTALEHSAIRNAVLDGDTYFLHVLERKLLAEGNDCSRSYYMPAKADRSVQAWRTWLTRHGGQVPTLDGPMPPLMTREQGLNRYEQHTKHCPDCSKAVRTMDTLSAMAAVCGLLCAAAVVAKLAAGQALLQLSTLAWGAAAGLCGLLYLGFQKFRQTFFFVDYVHAEKD